MPKSRRDGKAGVITGAAIRSCGGTLHTPAGNFKCQHQTKKGRLAPPFFAKPSLLFRA
jgi:hypothetical protein